MSKEKVKILLTFLGFSQNSYRVKRITGSTEFQPGMTLSKLEVDKLIDRDDITVVMEVRS